MIGHAGAPWQMDWSSVYSARALTLPDYVHHRIAFVGDAAHLLPIFGVRGANTGLQDAQNLAWKLGLTLRGRAGPGLMASYSAERVAAAREIIDEAGKSTRFMTPPSPGFRLLRDAVLSLSLSQDFVRPLYHWRTSRPHEYTLSALNALDDDNLQFQGGVANGAPMPNLRLADGSHLLDALCGEAAGHFSLLLAGAPPDAALQASVAGWRSRGLPLQVLLLADGPGPAPAGVDGLIVDADARVRQRLALPSAHGACLLRPDQHGAARWLQPDADRLDAALRQTLQRAATAPA
jgi:3-(3-hydroxy-phenyl)propionate hydroxylase